jgi:hypothetical protein
MLCTLFEYEMNPDRMGFPRSLYTLPVQTRTLVFWPWLIGTTSFGLWSVSCGTLVNWLAGAHEPVVVFSLGAAVCIGWLQVALWTPFQSPLKLLIFFAGVLLLIMFVAWLYVRSGLPEYAMVAVLGCLLALSYPAALAGVARDRRGDAWQPGLSVVARLWQFHRRAARLPQPFGSLARAQRWYNWWEPRSVVGRVMAAPLVTLLAAMGLGFLVSMLREQDPVPRPFPGPLIPSALFFFLPLVVLLPMRLLVRFPGAIGLDPIPRRPSYVLFRPISSGTLTATLLRTALRGVFWSWAFWLPLGLGACLWWNAVSAVPGSILQELKLFFGRLPTWEIVGVIVLSAMALVGLLWRLITDLLMVGVALDQPDHWPYLGLSLALAGLSGLVGAGLSLSLDPATRPLAVDVLAGAGVVILAVKVVVAAIAFRSARREGLLEGMSLRTSFQVWAVLAIALLSATAALLPGLQLPVPTTLVLLWIAILLPLGRFALLPLGLEALRHR